MFVDETLEIANYEVGYIKDGQENTILATDNLEEAITVYEYAVAKYSPSNTIHHIIVYLYDVEKQCNITYYSNYDEI